MNPPQHIEMHAAQICAPFRGIPDEEPIPEGFVALVLRPFVFFS